MHTTLLLGVIGVCETILATRLVVRLLAARPDNPFIQAFYAVTDPVIAPLQTLDAMQPRFGAILELSTLTLMTAIFLLGYVLWRAFTKTIQTPPVSS